jgi:ATP-dependent helicase/nuclease subunit B
MAEDEAMTDCTDAGVLAEFLWNVVRDHAAQDFGPNLPLQVVIQLESARQRLQAAARAQVALRQEGWETVASEVRFEGQLAGMPVVGKVDRVDRHRESGLLRILDYKTSDTAEHPATVHLGPSGGVDDFAVVTFKKRAKRWADLQLPLYRLLLAQEPEYAGPYELGYFNLPKAVNDTGVQVWEDFDETLLSSAEACASHIVQAVRDKVFWPPSERVRFDDFEDLFHGEADESFDVMAFKKWMKTK